MYPGRPVSPMRNRLLKRLEAPLSLRARLADAVRWSICDPGFRHQPPAFICRCQQLGLYYPRPACCCASTGAIPTETLGCRTTNLVDVASSFIAVLRRRRSTLYDPAAGCLGLEDIARMLTPRRQANGMLRKENKIQQYIARHHPRCAAVTDYMDTLMLGPVGRKREDSLPRLLLETVRPGRWRWSVSCRPESQPTTIATAPGELDGDAAPFQLAGRTRSASPRPLRPQRRRTAADMRREPGSGR